MWRTRKSAFSAPVFSVKKPENQWWMVVVERKLNENMMPDRFQLPRTDTIFNTLGAETYFESMNINQAFFQQTIKPEDREGMSHL